MAKFRGQNTALPHPQECNCMLQKDKNLKNLRPNLGEQRAGYLII